MSEYVCDALIVQDGTNPSFFSYIAIEEALRIQECGLANAETVILRETEDRPVSKTLQMGVTEIIDVQIKEDSKERLEANKWYHLN